MKKYEETVYWLKKLLAKTDKDFKVGAQAGMCAALAFAYGVTYDQAKKDLE